MDGANGEEDVFGFGAFDEIALRADFEGLTDGEFIGVHGEDDDAGGKLEGVDAFDGLKPVEAGHGNVDDEDVGLKTFDYFDGFEAVFGFTDDFDVGGAFKEGGDALTDDGMIVSDDDINHGVLL